MNKPLKLGDHKFLYNSTIDAELEAGYLLSDIQSAKRLLKQRTRCFLLPRVTALFHKEIDACFQIDDGKGEE